MNDQNRDRAEEYRELREVKGSPSMFAKPTRDPRRGYIPKNR